MNLSFSTRGWPDLGWDEMIDTALSMGFGGIEVYNLPKFNPLLDRSGPFHKYQAAATVRQLREKGLKIPCFDTSCDISSEPDCVQTLSNLMEVAHNTQVQYVVCCALTENEALVFENLKVLLPVAEKLDVTLLLKTSGIYSDTGRLRKMMDEYTIPIGIMANPATPPSRIWVTMSAMCICGTPMTKVSMS